MKIYYKVINKIKRFLDSLTVSIRIVADFVALSCQVTRTLKRVTALEFTTTSAIIFIHCWGLGFTLQVGLFRYEFHQLRLHSL